MAFERLTASDGISFSIGSELLGLKTIASRRMSRRTLSPSAATSTTTLKRTQQEPGGEQRPHGRDRHDTFDAGQHGNR
jgi:hypothetical protein